MAATATKEQVSRMLDRLTAKQQREVLRFIECVAAEDLSAACSSMEKSPPPPSSSPRHITGSGWYGGLADHKDQFTSGVALQHAMLTDWENID